MKRSSDVWGALLCLILGGCARTDVPAGLSAPGEAVRNPFGALALVRLDSSTAQGELLAVEPDTLFLIDGEVFRAVGRAEARQVKVFLQEYPLSHEAIVEITLLGTLSTLSNGFGLIITAPLWIITGTATGIAAAADANDGDFHYPAGSWAGLAKFARFPQGLPRTISRASLMSGR